MAKKRILNQIGVIFVICLSLSLSSQIANATIYYIDKNCSGHTNTYNQATVMRPIK